jgi:DNA relaxase NicK
MNAIRTRLAEIFARIRLIPPGPARVATRAKHVHLAMRLNTLDEQRDDVYPHITQKRELEWMRDLEKLDTEVLALAARTRSRGTGTA